MTRRPATTVEVGHVISCDPVDYSSVSVCQVVKCMFRQEVDSLMQPLSQREPGQLNSLPLTFGLTPHSSLPY